MGGKRTRDHSAMCFWQTVGRRIVPPPTMRVPRGHPHPPSPTPHTTDTASGCLVSAETHGADEDIRPLERLQIVPCMEVGCVCE